MEVEIDSAPNINDKLSDELLAKLLFLSTNIYDWFHISLVCQRWSNMFNEHIKRFGKLYYRTDDKIEVATKLISDSMKLSCDDNMHLDIFAVIYPYKSTKMDVQIKYSIAKDEIHNVIVDDDIRGLLGSDDKIDSSTMIEFVGDSIFTIAQISQKLTMIFDINSVNYIVVYEHGLITTVYVGGYKCLSGIIFTEICEYTRAFIMPTIKNTFGYVVSDKKYGECFDIIRNLRGAKYAAYNLTTIL